MRKSDESRMKKLVETFPDRFWGKVRIGGPNDCWEWQWCRCKFGYGFVARFGTATHAHRIAWELKNGPIPDGLCVLHHCDNPPCCNPKHLFLGTRADNVDDMKNKLRGRSGKTKLSPDDVRAIRRIYADGILSMQKIGDAFGVHWNTIQSVISGEFHKHVK